MVAPIQALQLSSVVARAAAADASLFKPGQVLEALVVGKTPDGMVALRIGDITVTAQLPQTLPPGTTLQLQVKAGGPAPQLAIVGTPQLPVAQALPPTPVMPNAPTMVSIPQPPPAVAPAQAPVIATVPAQVAQGVVAQPPAVGAPAAPPAPAVLSQPPAPNAPPPQASGQRLAQPSVQGSPQPSASPPAPPVPALPASLPTHVDAAPPRKIIESRQPLAVTSAPVDLRPPQAAQTVPQPAAANSAARPAVVGPQPVVQQAAPAVAQPPGPPPAPVAIQPAISAAPIVPTAATVAAPSPPGGQPVPAAPPAPVAQAPGASPQVASSPVQASPQPVVPTPSAPATAASVKPAPAAVSVAASAVAPAAVAPASPPQVAVPAVQAAPAAVATAPAVPQMTSQSAPVAAAQPVTVAAPAIEPEAASPLLVAQGAARPQPTAADLPKPLPLPSGSQQIQAQAAPTTPAAALAQMVPEAMARQNSVAPLLASLTTLVARLGAIPEPVLRAALQVLGQRVAIPPSGPTAQIVESALAKSGVYLEAGLAKGAPAADLKSALVALKGAAATWLGGNPAPVTAANQSAPPLRGLPPRAESADLPQLPEANREAARAIHSQADAALSRVKLMQLASLPDADLARAPVPELRMEVPFLIGQQLVMAQFQVLRDREQQRADGKRGWTMRFAMNFAEAGEVGAEIGLLARSVNVALWAADPSTAADLEAALPDLAPALAAIGLEPGAVRVRTLPPDPAKPQSGHFVDSRR